jgi:hypothetical protein
MISFTLLSLSPETLQRMASHDPASETGCRRSERVAAFSLALLVSVMATVTALLVAAT